MVCVLNDLATLVFKGVQHALGHRNELVRSQKNPKEGQCVPQKDFQRGPILCHAPAMIVNMQATEWLTFQAQIAGRRTISAPSTTRAAVGVQGLLSRIISCLDNRKHNACLTTYPLVYKTAIMLHATG